jgi:hypothetical protein
LGGNLGFLNTPYNKSMFDVPEEYEPYIHPDMDELPETLYHVAPRSQRDRIQAEGLLVDDSMTWNTGGDLGDDEWLYETGDDGERYRVEWRPHGVYMFPRLEQALDYIKHGKDDLYIISTEELSGVIRDPSVAMNWDYDDEHHAYVVTSVPTRALEMMPVHEITARLAEMPRYSRPILEPVNEAPAENQLNIFLTLPGLEKHLANISAIAQRRKLSAGYMNELGEFVSDDWCGQATEDISDYLTKQGVVHTAYHVGGEYWWDDNKDTFAPEGEGRWVPRFGGTDWDPSHAYIVLEDGTILDATITQFTRGQCEDYPRHPDYQDIGIIPYGHPLSAQYEAHQTGFGLTERPEWLSNSLSRSLSD